MATIKFKLSTKSDKNTRKNEILVRFFHGNFDQRGKTNIFIPSEYWNQKNQSVITPKFRTMTNEAKAIIEECSKANSRLNTISEYINNKFIESGAGKIELSSSWLVDILNEYNFAEETKPTTTLSLFEYYMTTSSVAESRKRHFAVVYRALTRFFMVSGLGTNITLDKLTIDTIRDFNQYLIDEHTFYQITKDNKGKKVVAYLNDDFKKALESVPESRLPEPRGQNALNHFLNEFKTFIIWAIENEYTTNNPFAKFEIPECKYGRPYYITIEERNHLYNYDFSSIPRLAIQRDIFVFQCLIGCRVSDLKRMTKESIINGAIEYIPVKTKGKNPDSVRVPLNSIAKEIVDRYKDYQGNQLLPFISDQKYNDAIKEMFTISGLNRMVTILNPTTREEEKQPLNVVASSHLARRCFIGNLYKQVKDPNLIGKLSGHVEGSRAFARYRDIDEEMKKELVSMLV